MKTKIVLSLVTVLALVFTVSADPINQIRKAEIDTTTEAPNIAKMVNDDVKKGRNYPMQPPLIPHNIRDYEVDLKVNKCLSCHARKRTEETQASMISVTHYMDRDGNFLAEVSPRRYFCNQCHVPQADLSEPIKNTFVDLDKVLNKKSEK
ncbi:nitrate reductase cytochrome c-type subunit [Catenovulum sp. SM1970]|uniref:nitrate reductase cytochrome c-type subunit n=1 Tax=Marinifaba aquimaris TaxID=2741323 RepID=UPI00157367F7|nr:nitrate reductase cytochrome c-type subunit [Marinifaba aquimaris]NTS78093.1 nitrate reductase cytochrome c-type subunit [Marinifaba aquimaris]